jgi:ATP-dependent 26S proteasome regulatory subunit
VDLVAVAKMCNGYVGADLQALCREAAMSALSHDEGVRPVEMKDFDEAHKRVGASIVRGSAAEVPEVSWNDIGGLHEVKVQFHSIRESLARELEAGCLISLYTREITVAMDLCRWSWHQASAPRERQQFRNYRRFCFCI